MLLQEMPQDDIATLDRRSIIVDWNENVAGVLDARKVVVMGCLELDPNNRTRLNDRLVKLW